MTTPLSPIKLSTQELNLFWNSPDLINLPPGEVLVTEGEPGDEMFVLLEGIVNITFKGRPIDRLEEGTIFGEMAMVDDRPRSATVTTATDCCVLAVNRTRFREIIRTHQKSPRGS